MSQLILHHAVTVKQSRHDFPATSERAGFFKLEFVVTDDKGVDTTITILSDEKILVDA